MSIQIAGASLTATANGLRHHVLSYGVGDRPPLLILPGITSPAATADFIATRIAALGYAVFVPDFRGRGRSERAGPGAYRLEDYAADVAGLIEGLDLDDPVIIGHSMGARIAAAYAADHGGSRRGLLVMVDPPLSGPGRDPYPTSLDSFLAQLAEAKAGTTIEAVRRFYPNWPERELRLRMDALPSCDETAVRESHAGFEREDFFAYWRRLRPPAVLIHGGRSPVVTEQGLADLAATNPAIPLIAVADAGHMIPWDNYEGFFEALGPWLKRPRSASDS